MTVPEIQIVPRHRIAPDVDPYPIRTIFRDCYPDYRRNHTVSNEQDKTAFCISNCKTGAFGYDISICPNCGKVVIHECSCNNRNCPCCQQPLEKKWTIARQSEMVEGVSYFHVVFTVPDELNCLIYHNQRELYSLLFHAASDTLLTLARDRKFLGAVPGIVMVLHTWGQQLNYHPHLHCIVSGGGLRFGKFVKCSSKSFFLPVRVMQEVFRGKFMAGLKDLNSHSRLSFPGDLGQLDTHDGWKDFVNRLYSIDWCPFEKYSEGDNAVKYLARYAYRTAISNSRVSFRNGVVNVRYKDYKDSSKEKMLTLSGEKFIERFLMHVLPPGFCRVRFAGYLANSVKTKKLTLICLAFNRIYTGNPVKGMKMADLIMLLYQRDITHCGSCGRELKRMRFGSRSPAIA